MRAPIDQILCLENHVSLSASQLFQSTFKQITYFWFFRPLVQGGKTLLLPHPTSLFSTPTVPYPLRGSRAGTPSGTPQAECQWGAPRGCATQHLRLHAHLPRAWSATMPGSTGEAGRGSIKILLTLIAEVDTQLIFWTGNKLYLRR